MRRFDAVVLFLACAARPAPALAQDCVNQRPTDPGARYAYAESAEAFDSEGGGFRIWYTEEGEHAVGDVVSGEVPESVRRSGAILDEAEQVFGAALGFLPPRSDADYPACSSNGGDGRLDVYLVDFNAADGSIGLDHCSDENPATCAGFLLVDHRFDAYLDFDTGARTVLPHEYFHLIQAAYAAPVATWWSEGSAQWATKQVYPDLLDMERYFGVYLDNVDRPLDLPPATAAQPFSYATAIFIVFLDERFGTDVVEDVFLAMNREALSEPAALDLVLGERGSGLGEAFVEFASWNVATGARAGQGGYRDAARYPELELPEVPADFDRGVSGTLAGLSANYHLVASDFDAELVAEVDAARTRVVFVPLSEGVAELDRAVSLPARVRGPGVLLVASLDADHRDASYRVIRSSVAPSSSRPSAAPSEDAGASAEEPPKLGSEGGCSLSAGRRPALPVAWGLLGLALALWLRRRSRLTLGAAATALSVGCSAAPAEPVASSRQPIVDGEPDTEHTAVFRLLTRKDGQSGLCTGVLIAPDLLLTARHCVAQTPPDPVRCGEFPFGRNLEPGELLASNALRPDLDSTWVAAREVRVRDPLADLCGADLALVRLAAPLEPKVATPFIPDLEGVATTSTPYTALGYGKTGDEAEEEYGERRRREGLRVECGTGECSEPVATTEFAGEAGICNGDSGGPALGNGKVVLGVASRGSDGCSTPVYAAVAPFADWLRAEAQRAAEQAGYESPAWAELATPREDAGRRVPEVDRRQLASEGCGVPPSTRRGGPGALALLGLVIGFALARARRPRVGAKRP